MLLSGTPRHPGCSSPRTNRILRGESCYAARVGVPAGYSSASTRVIPSMSSSTTHSQPRRRTRQFASATLLIPLLQVGVDVHVDPSEERQHVTAGVGAAGAATPRPNAPHRSGSLRGEPAPPPTDRLRRGRAPTSDLGVRNNVRGPTTTPWPGAPPAPAPCA